MDSKPIVDRAFDGFCSALEPSLADRARGLAHTLGLAPHREVPWSEVFSHEITLAAPALFVPATAVSATEVELAVSAHLLAVVQAFAIDRVEDGQIARTPELGDLLLQMTSAIEGAIGALAPGVEEVSLDVRRARRQTLSAIRDERDALRRQEGSSLSSYLLLSFRKQSLAFPASVALAYAAGWDVRRRAAVVDTLGAVAMGLQLHDDVVDWEEDAERGAAWVIALTRGMRPFCPSTGHEPSAVAGRTEVHASGVLARLLDRSAHYFRAARRRGVALGASRLAEWAAGQEAQAQALAQEERRAPGYTLRARALRAWAQEISI